MLKYIARRLAMLIIVVIGVTLITFTMMHLAPGDPAELIATAGYDLENLTEEDVERIRVAEGLDAPVYIQYLRWLGHTETGRQGCGLPYRGEGAAEFHAQLLWRCGRGQPRASRGDGPCGWGGTGEASPCLPLSQTVHH